MYIFKQPRIGGEVICHQDAAFLHTEPQSVLGLWFALEDATVENGCMYAAPGGHEGPLRSRFVREGDRTETITLDPTPLPTAGLVPLEAAKGTLVVLHGLLPHGSAPNRSATSRHAYALHVIDGRARYSADNWLQRAPEMPLRGF
jgi:phytanoyl-CoA hydroxylase